MLTCAVPVVTPRRIDLGRSIRLLKIKPGHGDVSVWERAPVLAVEPSRRQRDPVSERRRRYVLSWRSKFPAGSCDERQRDATSKYTPN